MTTRHADDLETLSRSERLRASPRMFESDFLDRFSRVHPAVPPILFVPAITILLIEGFVHGAGWATPLWIVGGYLFWTLTEYWLHRIVFHFEPEHGIGARVHWIIHGVHHDHPNDPMRLVMPPSVSIPLAALFVFGFSLVFGTPGFLPFARGLFGRLSVLRHAALPHAPSPPAHGAGQAHARAAHAPPLPGPRARLRSQRPVLGSRVRHAGHARALSPRPSAG